MRLGKITDFASSLLNASTQAVPPRAPMRLESTTSRAASTEPALANTNRSELRLRRREPIVDRLLHTAIELVAAIQSRLGIDPPSRSLSAAELGEMKKIFGDSVDYSLVRIKEDAGILTRPIPWLVQGNLGLVRPVFVTRNTIYVPRSKAPLHLSALAHEMLHVWQYQNGSGAYFSKALIAQRLGEGYDYREALDQGKTWAQLNPEQQASLIEDAFDVGYFRGTHNFPDAYKDALDRAVSELRAGRGAP